ncbi:hypothetical protein PFAS1_28320 [Pseudomonas frederiksbergensis]|nr:hypothetical protein PFAS1_28320 [Pseudomonas frederiksbergensis]
MFTLLIVIQLGGWVWAGFIKFRGFWVVAGKAQVGLLAMGGCQLNQYWLSWPHREQARSHRGLGD